MGADEGAAVKVIVHWVLVVVALGYVAVQAPPLLSAAGAAAGGLDNLRWSWAVAAVGLGVAAVLLYAEQHRELLAVGDAHVPGTTVASITLVQNAIGNTVPVIGGAAALAYATRTPSAASVAVGSTRPWRPGRCCSPACSPPSASSRWPPSPWF